MKKLLLVLLMSWVLLSGCSPSATTPEAQITESEDPIADVEAAVRAALPELKVEGDPLRIDVSLDIDYARADITRQDGVNSIGTAVFLKREGGQWQILTHGSYFDPKDLEALGIPPTLIYTLQEVP